MKGVDLVTQVVACASAVALASCGGHRADADGWRWHTVGPVSVQVPSGVQILDLPYDVLEINPGSTGFRLWPKGKRSVDVYIWPSPECTTDLERRQAVITGALQAEKELSVLFRYHFEPGIARAEAVVQEGTKQTRVILIAKRLYYEVYAPPDVPWVDEFLDRLDKE